MCSLVSHSWRTISTSKTCNVVMSAFSRSETCTGGVERSETQPGGCSRVPLPLTITPNIYLLLSLLLTCYLQLFIATLLLSLL